jgi:alpha-beta hydrolase superfamily lysophospholipase
VLTELVTVLSADGVDLDGALYESPTSSSRPRARVLMVHGLTWNFYRGPSRWLPGLLAAAGYECLSLNMRDHDLQQPKDFDLSYHDLRAGLAYLRERNGTPVVALAHGYACNKLICYPALSGDPCLRHYVLTTLGGVKSYRPELWEQVLHLAPRIEGNVLLIQGAADPNIDVHARAKELVSAATGAGVEVVMLEGGNHYFDGRHAELAGAICEWLDRALGFEKDAKAPA